MNIVPIVLQIIALACFFCVLAAFFVPYALRLVGAGLFCWLLSLMITAQLHAAH